MSVRKLAGALALAAAVVLSAGAARAADVITLKLSHFVPPVHAFHKWVVKWTEKIEKESGGRLKFEIYPNGQLVGPPNRQFDAARNGITDIAFCLHGVTPGRYPMTELANLPFTWPSSGADLPEMAKRMTELAPKYLAAEHQGLHILWMQMANPVVIYSKTPIKTLDDFKGKKIRYASITNKFMLESVGAVPMLVPPQESQDALAKGVVDGARSFGKSWQDFEKFARETEIKKGLKITTLSPADVAKMKELAKPIIEKALDEQEKAGKPAREFFAAYTK